MLKKFTKVFITGLFLLSFSLSYSQGDIDQLLESSLEDANTLMKAYTDPFMTGFGAGLGSGWYNTAKAHKSLGFDLGFTVGLAYVPDEDLFFDVSSLSLNNTNVAADNPFGDRAPTIFGPDTEPRFEYTYTDDNTGQTFTEQFSGPPGTGLEEEIGFAAAPVIIPQLGIGIVKNTDLKIRWLPEIDLGDDGKFKLFGIGVMHDVKQHIPGLKLAPFDMSVLVAFTDVTTTVDLSDSADPSTAGQSGLFDVNTWTFQALASKKFSVLTLYGGLGFNRVRSELKLLGDYTVNDDAGNETTISDPIDLEFKSGGARFTAGMRLKLAILTLHADYTFQKYNVLSVGLGFAVR